MIKLFEKLTGLRFVRHELIPWILDERKELLFPPFMMHKGSKFFIPAGYSHVQKCLECGYVRNIWVDKLITFFARRRNYHN